MIEIKTDDMGVKRGYKPRKPGGGRKKRKPLITAGVYESDVAEKVQDAFEKYRKHKTIKPHCYQPQQPLTYPKPLSPRTCLIRKVCTFQVQKKRKSVLEQSGSGDTER